MAKATADSIVASRKLSLAFVSLLSLCTSVRAEANFTVWVNRRSTGDLYRLNSTAEHEHCHLNTSYLIDEKQCAMDEELLNGCGVAIVPIDSTSLIPTVAIDSQYSAIITKSFKSGDSPKKHVLIFGFNGTNQAVNSSFCNISSLEVYRGREQAIEISHQGFSLGDNGSIEIHDHQLAYGTDNYTGELYHMNLSCSGGGLPESGCLFFKVAGNISTIEDKFNGIVSGTFQPDGDNEQQSTDPTGENITVYSVSTTVADMVESTTKVSILAIGSTLFYILIGVGGVIFLFFSFIIMCVLIGFSIQRKRKSHTFSIAATLPPNNGILMQGSEPSPYETPYPSSAEIADDLTLMSNNGYQCHPTRNTTTAGSDHRIGQDRYQVHIFSTEVEQIGSTLPEGNNNSAPIQSPPECNIQHSPIDSKEDLELSQVYDAVSPKPPEEREAGGMVYNQLTHSSLHGKQSLPAYLGLSSAPEYSALQLNTWKGSSHAISLDESIPVYNAPIVKKKGKKSDVEHATMVPSSQKLSSCSCPPLPLSSLESRDVDLEHMYAILEQDRLQQSTHKQTANTIPAESDHTCVAILEQSQQQLSTAACAQTMNTESDHMHMYAILEQGQEEGLPLNKEVDRDHAILEQGQEGGYSPNKDNTGNIDIEHTYAILEQDTHSTHEQTEPICRILDDDGQPNNSWMSNSLRSQESQRIRKHSRSKSREENFELVRIYNTVSLKARANDAKHKQHSHQSCSKKQSLPSYFGARPMEYPPVHIRDTHGVTRKDKERKNSRKKETTKPSNGEAAMAASHKISTTSCPPLSLFTDSGAANTGRCNTIGGQYPPVGATYQRKD